MGCAGIDAVNKHTRRAGAERHGISGLVSGEGNISEQ